MLPSANCLLVRLTTSCAANQMMNRLCERVLLTYLRITCSQHHSKIANMHALTNSITNRDQECHQNGAMQCDIRTHVYRIDNRVHCHFLLLPSSSSSSSSSSSEMEKARPHNAHIMLHGFFECIVLWECKCQRFGTYRIPIPTSTTKRNIIHCRWHEIVLVNTFYLFRFWFTTYWNNHCTLDENGIAIWIYQVQYSIVAFHFFPHSFNWNFLFHLTPPQPNFASNFSAHRISFDVCSLQNEYHEIHMKQWSHT